MNIENSSSDYCVEIDRISKKEWETLILPFRDATINQTWSFGAALSGEQNLSHIVLKRNSSVLAAAQVRIVTLPILKAGIAYVGWGPMWRRADAEDDVYCLRYILEALRCEYARKRGLLLRVLPNLFDNYADAEAVCCAFAEVGFERKESPHQTLFLSLKPSLEELRKGLHPRWRNYLSQGERSNMEIREGIDEELFDRFRTVYREMITRKKYATDVDIERYATIQKRLPDTLKPRIVLCEQKVKTMAGGVFSTIGDTGIFLLGATSDEALENRAAYLVHWRMISWLKDNGFRWYDLGGVDAKKTPGTYHFKARICGREPRVNTRIGDFVACESLVSTLAVKSGDFVKSWKSRIKGKIASSGKHIDHQRR